jgi:hypothetical protein
MPQVCLQCGEAFKFSHRHSKQHRVWTLTDLATHMVMVSQLDGTSRANADMIGQLCALEPQFRAGVGDMGKAALQRLLQDLKDQPVWPRDTDLVPAPRAEEPAPTTEESTSESDSGASPPCL